MTSTLSIIIPVYNEKDTIKILLNRVYNHKLTNIKRELIIIESNSTDGSREYVKNFAHGKKDVQLILEDKPQGKGHALRVGFKKATGDIILIQDADLEYDVNDYEKLIRPILESKTMFVLGSRHLSEDGKRNWGIRKFHGTERIYAYFMNFGGLFLHAFFNVLYGTDISDPTTMYKVFSRDILKKIHLEGNYFELDWEIVSKFIRLGIKPIEIPIKYSSRSPKQGKKVKLSRDIMKWLVTIIKFRYYPLNKL